MNKIKQVVAALALFGCMCSLGWIAEVNAPDLV